MEVFRRGFRQEGDDGGAALDGVAFAYAEVGVRRKEDIDAGAELDEADALAFFEDVAGLGPADDAAGEEAGDLLDLDRELAVLDDEGVLLVEDVGVCAHGIEEEAAPVVDVGDGAGDG